MLLFEERPLDKSRSFRNDDRYVPANRHQVDDTRPGTVSRSTSTPRTDRTGATITSRGSQSPTNSFIRADLWLPTRRRQSHERLGLDELTPTLKAARWQQHQLRVRHGEQSPAQLPGGFPRSRVPRSSHAIWKRGATASRAGTSCSQISGAGLVPKPAGSAPGRGFQRREPLRRIATSTLLQPPACSFSAGSAGSLRVDRPDGHENLPPRPRFGSTRTPWPRASERPLTCASAQRAGVR